ncbi:hypothetical protein [Clostridium paraputrificum]|uniref:NlpC/P60 family protein n=1 Tax=Clostridium paraputrificum TaxID=29363 RepID=A0A6N3F048_9CLOT
MFGFFNSASRRLNKFNRTRGGLSKIIKIMGIFLVFVFSVALVITLGEDDQVGGSDAKGTQFVKRVETEKLPETNPDGTTNGLNLLLIGRLSEGYVKEYLEIAQKLENGELGPLANKVTVERTLGVAATEQGNYSGLPILGSPLPLKDGKPLWDKSINMTLSTAYFDDYQKHGFTPSFAVTGNDTGGYYSGWQVNVDYASQVDKSSMNKKGSLDKYFFPDQMYSFAQVRNWKYPSVERNVDVNVVSEGAIEMAVSILYSGSPLFSYLPGDTKLDKTMALENVYNWTHEHFIEKYRHVLKYDILAQGWASKHLAVMINVAEGGKISQQTYDYVTRGPQRDVCTTFLKAINSDKSLEDFLSPAVDSSLARRNNASGIMYNLVGGKEYMMVPESTGHYVGEELLGALCYGRMLKFGGLEDVDPTNPDTYMNRFEDEWLPNGTGDWLKECGVDPSNLNPKILAILNEGYKLRGTPYYLGDPIVPKKNADGSYDVKTGRFDCSSFLQYIIKTITNIDIGRNTTMQLNSPNLEDISMKDLKTGDIIILGNNGVTEHVIMYLSGDATTNSFWYMDTGSNATGGVKVTNNASYQHANRKQWWPKRVKGID